MQMEIELEVSAVNVASPGLGGEDVVVGEWRPRVRLH